MPSQKEGLFFYVSMYHKWLFRFSVFTAACTFLLIIAGGMVTSTGSGLAVPDWPLSYGQIMPPMVGGIFYEHGHRMIASFVGFLTVILTIWILRVEERRWLKRLAIVALSAVVVQGLLGGLTVKLMLPAEVSASHATLAQSFFCIVSAISLFLSPWWNSDGGMSLKAELFGRNRMYLTMAVLAVFVQLILGAIMRHTHSGLAVPDFPLAYGQILPSLSEEKMAEYNDDLIKSDIRLYADGPITASQVIIHLVHRFWGLVVFTVLVVAAFRLWRLRQMNSRLGFLAVLMSISAVSQIALGAYTVLSKKAVVLATAHQSTGAFILMLTVISLLHIYRLAGWTDLDLGTEKQHAVV